jgi:hypothetical protein
VSLAACFARNPPRTVAEMNDILWCHLLAGWDEEEGYALAIDFAVLENKQRESDEIYTAIRSTP